MGNLLILFWILQLSFFESSFQKVKNLQSKEKKDVLVKIFVFGFLLFHFLIPFRGYFYEGNVNWTQQGYNFSWKFRVNDIKGGIDTILKILYANEDKILNEIRISDYFFLSPVVGCTPPLFHQFAHQIATDYKNKFHLTEKPRVYALTNCSLNYREKQPIVSPTFNLISSPLWEFPLPWILPLKN